MTEYLTLEVIQQPDLNVDCHEDNRGKQHDFGPLTSGGTLGIKWLLHPYTIFDLYFDLVPWDGGTGAGVPIIAAFVGGDIVAAF